MAIRAMVSKEEFEKDPANIEVVTDYPGHETATVYHHWECPHSKAHDARDKITPECAGRCHYYDPLYMKTSHRGLVLSLGEYNGYDDSDFYAVVWNPEKGETERVTYASTRGWTYPNNATVDATPEVVAAYHAWRKAREEAARKAAAEREARTPAKGKTLKVVRGVKVPKGTTGTCIWLGKDKYAGKPRVGIKDASGTVHWTAASNCEVVLPSA
jgi:hypothetical protein